MLYQLGKYNTKDNLSTQSKRVRDHIQKNWDFESTYEIIKTYENLEFETVSILTKAINAGYWNSGFGLHWDGIIKLQNSLLLIQMQEPQRLGKNKEYDKVDACKINIFRR